MGFICFVLRRFTGHSSYDSPLPRPVCISVQYIPRVSLHCLPSPGMSFGVWFVAQGHTTLAVVRVCMRKEGPFVKKALIWCWLELEIGMHSKLMHCLLYRTGICLYQNFHHRDKASDLRGGNNEQCPGCGINNKLHGFINKYLVSLPWGKQRARIEALRFSLRPHALQYISVPTLNP